MRIQTRVFLTLLTTAIVLVTTLALMTQWSIERGLIAHVNARILAEHQDIANNLVELYEMDQWARFYTNPRLFHRVMSNSRNGPPPMGRPGMGPPPQRPEDRGQRAEPPPEAPSQGAIQGHIQGPTQGPIQAPPEARRGATLIDANKNLVAGPARQFEESVQIPLNSKGTTIGWLLLPRTDRITEDYDIQFAQQLQQNIYILAIFITLLTGLVAYIFAPGIVRPIRKLADAANQLARKDYELTLELERKDELGELSRDIHELAHTLKASEETRQKWFADTSHELRTPVAIIRGELEAMIDCVRPMNVDNLNSVRQEVLRLQGLIEDLSALARADIGSLHYKKTTLDVSELIAETQKHYQHLCEEAGLKFHLLQSHTNATVYGDADRLLQLVTNLIANSSNYTDAPGQVTLSLTNDESSLYIVVDDSAPGVPEDALDHLFDYLFRVESSRNRLTGGAGLGLAICARIVEAHNGSISAANSELGGVKITVDLPLEIS